MRTLVRSAAILAVILVFSPADRNLSAQVVTDGTLGVRAIIPGPTYALPDTLGNRRGGNLFHSFSTFNIRTGETAVFSGAAGILNILARITGGARSDIDGRLRSTIVGANLFVLNPSGILFGPNAALDVRGSFYASSGSYIRLADGVRFTASSSPDIVLTSAPPDSFGFNGLSGPITVSGSTLTVPSGRQLGLFGGDITIGRGNRSATIQALGGRIYLVSAASAGEVRFDQQTFDTSALAQLGSIIVRDGALVSVNESSLRTGGGTIVVRAGNFLLENSALESRTRFVTGGGIDILARERLDIFTGNVISVTTGAAGAGSISLVGRNILIKDASLVDTSCDPGCTTGNGGRLNINASGNLSIEGTSPTYSTFVVSNSFGGGNTGAVTLAAGALNISGNAAVQAVAQGAGNSSGIAITSGSIALSGGGQISAETRSSGAGGNIVINNSGAIRIDGTRTDPSRPNSSLPSGIIANAAGSGNGGSITISTRTLEVISGGEISTSAGRFATGAGGKISINALEKILVSGTDAAGKSSGIVANTFGKGNAGAIELTADTIEISNKGLVQVMTEGDGAANVIRIRARNLALASAGQLSSETRGRGAGGTIDVNVTDVVSITGTIIGTTSGIFANTTGAGKGGSVFVQADRIVLDGPGGIFAGNVGTRENGTGNGGAVNLMAGSLLRVANGASVASGSSGRGIAGDINITSNQDIDLDRGRITTSAIFSDGGNISLRAGNRVFLNGGSVDTAVSLGFGDGGNIRMQQPLLLLRGGIVSANAYGGAGGNIRIAANNLFQSGDSRITASSQLGIDGTVILESPAIDPSGELIAPPASYLNVSAILASRCGPRLAGKASSLVLNDIGFPANTSAQLQLPLAQNTSPLSASELVSCTPEQTLSFMPVTY